MQPMIAKLQGKMTLFSEAIEVRLFWLLLSSNNSSRETIHMITVISTRVFAFLISLPFEPYYIQSQVQRSIAYKIALHSWLPHAYY